jgi:glucose/arabinose dehydrogenase/mono/diheme cytochrome c family protein
MFSSNRNLGSAGTPLPQLHSGAVTPLPVKARGTGRAGRVSGAAALVLLIVAGAVVLGWAAPSGLALQTASSADPNEVECRWTDRPIKVDGAADEQAWRGAHRIENFRVPPAEGGTATRPISRSRARLLWDRENLYFYAELEDPDLVVKEKEHDGNLWLSDVLELFFKPADDKPGYYEFEINPVGAILDLYFRGRGKNSLDFAKKDGEFHIESKVRVDGTVNEAGGDRRWSVEGRIPWTDFLRTGGRPEVNEVWKFALCRFDYTQGKERGEQSSNAPLSRPDFHRYEDYAKLRFAGPNRLTAAPFGIEQYTPLTTSRVTGQPDPLPPYRARKVYPRLKLGNPTMVKHEPGTKNLLAVVHQIPGGSTGIVRFRDDPNVEQVEELVKFDKMAYDFTFHPKYTENGFLYVGAKGPMSGNAVKKMAVLRYTVGRDAAHRLDPKSEKNIIEWVSDGHDGGSPAFGLDGMLYVTTGDGTSDSDVNLAGQKMDHLLAKLLRIDVDHPAPGKEYSVPADNPFVGREGIVPETWAYGFRNPWRMTVDERTGHVWVGQNGQDLWESAMLIEKGANYGWSVYEGSHPFYLNRTLGPTPHVKPTIEHHHSEARSLTGGIVYYGKRYPELQGAYIYGDYSTGKIWGMKHDGTRPLWHRELTDTALQIVGFGTDSEGEILITDYVNGVYTLDPTPKDLPPSNFPRKLSETGLFRSVRGHKMQPGLIPYSVNAPLWSDGAQKERFIGLPGKDAKIDYTPTRGWNFPDQSVLVKSFALEAEEGNPASRRWIETRLLTRQDGEWVGYSYLWNDSQTDATLVESKGADREYTVRVSVSAQNPDGVRKQKWHYPSRAECMVCHSRAANWVLGLTQHQMNKTHDYGKVRDNQLRVLEHLGVLRYNYQDAARELLRAEGRSRGLTDGALNAYVGRQTESAGQRQAVTASTHFEKNPESLPRLVDPYDRKQDLGSRARSYLQANCAQCHVEAGGGNSQILLEYTAVGAAMKAIDVKPLHHTFNLPDARILAPGHPERSTLIHRVAGRGEGRMPPLATELVDQPAVELLTEWVRSLRPAASR